MGKRWVLCALIVLTGLLGSVAVADTGGSMGGGDWSSSSSGGGGGYSGGGGDYSSSSGWSSSGDGGSVGGGEALLYVVGAVFILLMRGAIALGVGKDANAPFDSDNYAFTPTYMAPLDSVDVTALRIAIDGRARKFVQTEIKNIANETDTSTNEGRTAMLREVAVLMRRLRDAWVYGGAVNEPMGSPSTQKAEFDRLVDDARSRFREETLRNEQGKKTTTAASSYTPHSDEGAGLILVSIIIAARRELFTVNRIGNGDDLRQALDAASQLTPASLVAIEVVWQPSEDDDRLSSMELEAKYPRPDLIPIQGALVGKTFCAYCGGPYPAELVSCPHCGAPAAEKHAA